MVGTEAIGRLLRLAGVGPREQSETHGSPEFPYVCRGCGTAYDVQYHVCPDCGGFSVERRVDDGVASD
ncbi:hypothetical protein GL213_11685 [Halogeometricum borinquense]|uniref:Hydrogenase maturation nickel metallochaperone HypA n=1 Tax=Halogeometricum borinquense TaxID=60847 RepID=A0A482TH01_9EURY|nr:hypothetical protein [Halogeometricum borinquense]QIB72787.1 hypothetical protein G3I44_03725 [Halogeometricum borinquense]QIQ75065.1 hypothetical protein GL213_11685 [Halogeometricum borinquense]RYJ13193.1 hypothetical protein ELS19_03855 [Halogeometricum borinquense]